MDKNKMVIKTKKKIWWMATSMYFIAFLLIMLFRHFNNLSFTPLWWTTLICLSGAFLIGGVFIAYWLLLLHINKETENES